MEVKAAFNNADKSVLGKRMEELGLEPYLIWWTMSFMADRQFKLVLDGEEGHARPVDTGIPQGSPAASIIFVTYLSGIFDAVEKACRSIRVLSCVDDIAWWAEGSNDQDVVDRLIGAVAAAGPLAARNGVSFGRGRRRLPCSIESEPAPQSIIS
jgi:hypothetical protein